MKIKLSLSSFVVFEWYPCDEDCQVRVSIVAVIWVVQWEQEFLLCDTWLVRIIQTDLVHTQPVLVIMVIVVLVSGRRCSLPVY